MSHVSLLTYQVARIKIGTHTSNEKNTSVTDLVMRAEDPMFIRGLGRLVFPYSALSQEYISAEPQLIGPKNSEKLSGSSMGGPP
jgi:hypothetical protein